MRTPGAQEREPERGQASVELLGALPAVLLVALAAWQLVLAGQAAWLAEMRPGLARAPRSSGPTATQRRAGHCPSTCGGGCR